MDMTRIKAKYFYLDGDSNQIDGDYVSYHVFGRPRYKANFNKGKIIGKVKEYHASGRVKLEGDYINGKKELFKEQVVQVPAPTPQINVQMPPQQNHRGPNSVFAIFLGILMMLSSPFIFFAGSFFLAAVAFFLGIIVFINGI